jgi:polysaccharide biosynthesis transport protein
MTNPEPVGAPAGVGNAGELDLRGFFRLLMRRRWIIVGAVLVSVAGAGVVTLRSPRMYQAATRVIIDKNPPQVLADDVREVYALGTQGYWLSQEYYSTQYELIRSEPVARRVAGTLGIDGPALAQQVRNLEAETLEARVAADPLSELPEPLRKKIELIGLGGATSRAGLIADLEAYDAVAFVRNRIIVEPLAETQLADIIVVDTDPERAALLANTVTDAYVDLNVEQKAEFSASAVDWLSDQVRELKDRLQESEMKLHEFKKENNIVSVSLEDRQTMIAQSLTSLNQSLSETQAKRLAEESRVALIERAAKQEEEFEGFADLQNGQLVQQLKLAESELNRELAEMSLRYTEEHPKLIATRKKLALVQVDLSNEIAKGLRQVEEQRRALADTEQRLRRAIDDLKQEALDLNKKEIDYRRLAREAENNAELYKLVLRRQKEVSLTRMLKANNVRVLEPARPPGAPVSPRPRVNFLVGLSIGLLLGLGLAFLVDYLDSTVKTQEQIEQLVGLPFLGILPSIKTETKASDAEPRSRDLFTIDNPRSSVAECARTIRTNLMFMSPDEPARTLLITSAGPREGKSTLGVSLAITMAQSGLSTVIVDTDMRRPRLHRTFGVANEVGLTTALLGERTLERAVQNSGVAGLDLLTCGPLPPNPAELLHTEAFKGILEALRKRYARVVFDSPPVGAVSDALILSSMTDGVVLVVNAATTSWQAARHARRAIEDVGGRLFGAVLNNVDLDRAPASYYQYYQYRYEEDDDRGTGKKTA